MVLAALHDAGEQAPKQGAHLETREGNGLEGMVPQALMTTLVTTEKKNTWICDQFRRRTEKIFNGLALTGRKKEVFYLVLSLKKPAGHPRTSRNF